MKVFTKTLLIAAMGCMVAVQGFSQTAGDNLPKDYLSKEFHAGRRQALRDMMPANSVAVIFAFPLRTFSNDVTYAYHPNPDLYYFSGYKETDGVLLIFKEMQHSADGDYNEVFFSQKRDPAQEQWTGRRLGVEGVKSKLGFTKVYNSEDFSNFAIDFKKFSSVLYDDIPSDEGNMKPLIDAFRAKTGVPDYDSEVLGTLSMIAERGTPKNISRVMTFFKSKFDQDNYKSNPLVQVLLNKPDSVGLADMKAKFNAQFGGLVAYSDDMNALRGVKQPEEVALVKRAVEISAIAHDEAMRAVKPTTSERELQGIYEYVHKKYGAEDEGYPPIVGAGANGCILHYEENAVMQVKKPTGIG